MLRIMNVLNQAGKTSFMIGKQTKTNSGCLHPITRSASANAAKRLATFDWFDSDSGAYLREDC